MNQEFRLETIADPAGLENVRVFVEETLRTYGVEPDMAIGVLVAVNELTTNVFVHGYAGRPGPLEVMIGWRDDLLYVRILDEAPPFDPASPPAIDIEQPLHERPRGGMGIQLAGSYADEIVHGLRPGGGNEVTLVISDIKFS